MGIRVVNLYTCPTHAINILLPGGLLGSVRAPFVSPFSTTYGYDAAGRSTVTTLPNGTTASSTYDNAGRLTVLENKGAAGTTISRHEYTLDGNGNRTAADEVNGAFSGVTTFGYDDVNRLIEAAYPSNQATNHRRVTYTYNDGGDRTALSKWTGSPGRWSLLGSAATYSYDEAGRMTTAAGVNYTHDRNGNQTGRGADTFTFNALNRMTQVSISGAASTYTYDGNGVRTQKVTGGVTTDYLQDVNGRLPRVAVENVGSASTYYAYGKNLIARRASDQSVQYYHFDATGNVRAITNAAGAVTEWYDYDAFGALRNTPNGVTNDRRFSGEQRDGETGYSFLRARYYDPAIGRFTGRDAVEGGNSYTYTSNNPVNFVDPSGYSEEDGEGWSPCPSSGCTIGYNAGTGQWACGFGPTPCSGAAGALSGLNATGPRPSAHQGYGYDYSYRLGIPLRVGAAGVMNFFLRNFGKVFPLFNNCDSLSKVGQECFLTAGVPPLSGSVQLIDMGATYFSFLALEDHRERGSIIYFSTLESSGDLMLRARAFGPAHFGSQVDEKALYLLWATLAVRLHDAWVWDHP
ncbi:MAG: RHS repeat-associated core domain-containing protein [Chloroflexi bacterium]|nr:RHS repeat-associated core domain-containing protein [Chloroflexota bacterium]